VTIVAPCEGTGYEIGSMSIIRGARNMENARRFYDWALTAEAQAIAAQANSFQLPSNRNAPIPPEAPRFEDVRLIDYDFARWGNRDVRTALLQRWEREVRAGAR
jgi:iron(III) transport system substrate-binding protein